MSPPPHRPAPPVQLRGFLVDCRAGGLDFEAAWTWSLKAVIWPHDTVHRRQWRESFKWSRAEWHAAYEGMETRASALLRDFNPDVFLASEEDDLAVA